MDTQPLQWRIEMLGGLRARSAGRVVERFQTQKTGALLAFLACHPDRRHSREELVDLLWPDAEIGPGRNRLSQAVGWLRSRFEPDGAAPGSVLLADRQSVGLSRELVMTDVAEFEAALSAAEGGGAAEVPSLQRALALYRGELLPGHYDAWVLAERARLLGLYLSGLRRLAAHHEHERDWDAALTCARRAVAADPLAEELHCDLIRLLAAGGQPGAARRQFRELERLLAEELDEPPSAAARALRDRIQQDGQVRQDSPSPPMPGKAPRPPLPSPLTRFFGRDAEVARTMALVQTEGVRLVTLTGTGGAGKTRLAIEAATRLADSYRGCLWFVPLADLSDARLLPNALADVLRLPQTGPDPLLETVAGSLARRPSLLVLDNFEHLRDGAAPLLRDLLAWAPTLTVLVTSRHRLGLEGEQELSVPPLSLPPRSPLTGSDQAGAEAVMRVDSVCLFVDRARAVRPDFAVTPGNADAVADLCRRLEGLPLALELCAAWAQTLTPAQMLSQLTHRFDLLVSRRADIAPRHRSLRAALEYSYLLLPPSLQEFFIQVSVFRGGWTLEAAEAVCLGGTPGGQALAALTSLTELRERSLLIVEGGAEPGQDSGMRYRMLEALREFAAEQRTLAEEPGLRRHHAAYFLRLAEDAGAHLSGPRQALWLARLEAEHDNLRAALGWSVESQDAGTGLRLAVTLSKFWEMRGYFREARQWLERLLPLAPEPGPGGAGPGGAGNRLWAQTLTAYANALEGLTDFAAAEAQAGKALAVWRNLGDASGMASTLALLGSIAMMHEDYGPAVRLLQEARGLARDAGDERMAAGAVHNLGRIALARQDWSEASDALAESLEAHRALGDRNKAAAARNNLGLVARYRGDLGAARALLHQALAEHRELGDRPRTAISLLNIGTVERIARRGDEAASALTQATALALEIDDRRVQTWCVKETGHLMCAERRWATGVRLLSASEGLRRTLGMSFSPADPGELSRDVSLARSALGDTGFEAAWQAGCGWDIRQACAQATQAVEGSDQAPFSGHGI